MKKWFKKILGITDIEKELERMNNRSNYQSKIISNLQSTTNILLKDFEENNRISMDICFKEKSFIILSGIWKGKQYVDVQEVHTNQFSYFIEQLKRTKRSSFKDSPIGYNYFD